MIIFPAIDLVGGKAVRLYKGRYDDMTVYSQHPENVATDFYEKGARHVHIVDLEGARDGGTPNFDTVLKIKKTCPDMFLEIGGGIRTMETVDTYLTHGLDRVILGTAAVTDEDFLKAALAKYGKKIAVGADIKDGMVAIKGWLEKSELTMDAFFEKMSTLGVDTIICTDISKDGAMRGTNLEMYHELSGKYNMNIVASGGVSSIDDIHKLTEMHIYGAIIGKAYYIGAIDLAEAVKISIGD